jgi:hypothetical protein
MRDFHIFPSITHPTQFNSKRGTLQIKVLLDCDSDERLSSPFLRKIDSVDLQRFDEELTRPTTQKSTVSQLRERLRRR